MHLTIFLVLKIVIDFTATWCGPCQYIQPAVNEFAEIYTDVDFIKIDVDELEVCIPCPYQLKPSNMLTDASVSRSNWSWIM